MKWDKAGLAAWMLVALCVLGFAWFMVHNGAFLGDDLDNFLSVRSGKLLELMIAPVPGGHWSPFHRFSTWLVYNMAPMRFEAAVFVLMCFHVGTLIYLHATLRMLGLNVADKVILCMYASCTLLIYGMIWWANAQLRVPHVLLCAAAIFHYLSWLKGNSNRQLWLAATAYLLDMLVYQKAVLIPVYMLVVGYLAEPVRFREKPVAVPALPVALLVVSLLVTAVFKYLSPPEPFPPTIKIILHMEGQFLSALGGGLLGMVVDKVPDLGSAYVVRQQYATLGILFVMIVATLRASPGTWKLWIALFGVLALDYLPLSASNRYLFGPVIPYSYRYHFESVYLVALFAGLFCVQILRDRKSPPGPIRTRVLPFAIVVVYLSANVASLAIARENEWEFRREIKCHDYMNNLQEGLGRIEEPSPTFVDSDSRVPWQMGDLAGRVRIRDLVPLFIPAARFTSANEARYQVLPSGEVVDQSRP
jgi:hypothetical protein